MSYEKIGAHSVSRNPHTLLEPDPERKVTWLNDKAIPMIFGFFGTVPFGIANWVARMPWYAGAWRMVLGAGVMVPAGYYYHFYREERLAEYDALLRWYIAEHPEEFSVPERKKVGELFKEWTPIR